MSVTDAATLAALLQVSLQFRRNGTHRTCAGDWPAGRSSLTALTEG